jgi:hypothetical protein
MTRLFHLFVMCICLGVGACGEFGYEFNRSYNAARYGYSPTPRGGRTPAATGGYSYGDPSPFEGPHIVVPYGSRGPVLVDIIE